MDELARFNKQRWEALAEAHIVYSVPLLNMDESAARALVDPEGLIGAVRGKRILCLAGGGGQQSAAFGLLGADVTTLDLSETQLERDREAARHYGLKIATVHGDMRDLSGFDEDRFDVVWHAHSINFVPDATEVFRQVRRVLKAGGIYHFSCSNPYFHSVEPEDWNGEAYPLRERYAQGELSFPDPHWTFTSPDGSRQRVEGPREFRHTLETLVNGLTALGFVLLRLREDTARDPDAEPGSWDHFRSIAPPYLEFWSSLGHTG